MTTKERNRAIAQRAFALADRITQHLNVRPAQRILAAVEGQTRRSPRTMAAALTDVAVAVHQSKNLTNGQRTTAYDAIYSAADAADLATRNEGCRASQAYYRAHQAARALGAT